MCLSQQIPLPVVPNPQLLRTGLLLPVPVGLPRVHLLRAAESGGPADRVQGDLALLHLLFITSTPRTQRFDPRDLGGLVIGQVCMKGFPLV